MQANFLRDKIYRDHIDSQTAPPRFEGHNLPDHYPPDLELEPTHLFIDLYFSIPARSVGGRVTTTVVAKHAGPLMLKLDAVDFDDLSVRDINDHALTWQYDGRKLLITWETPFAAQESRQIEVAYRIVAPTAGLYFSMPDESYPNQPSYMVSDHETERARHWLPCIDYPNVRTTLDLRLRADARFTILANGYLVDENDQGDGTKTAHWRLEQPCPSYLICDCHRRIYLRRRWRICGRWSSYTCSLLRGCRAQRR